MAVCGDDQSLLKYLALWALNLSGVKKKKNKSSHFQIPVLALFLGTHAHSSSQPLCVFAAF